MAWSSGVACFISVSVKIKSRPCSQRLYSVVMKMMVINMKGKMSSQEVMRMMMRRKQLWRQEQKTLPIRLFFNSTFFKFLIGIPNICYKIYGQGKWIFFVAMFLRGRLSCLSNEKPNNFWKLKTTPGRKHLIWLKRCMLIYLILTKSDWYYLMLLSYHNLQIKYSDSFFLG